jgi:uncharacterized protein (DUF2235 family)
MKRIVICCDGTWQDENADYPTNVALIAQAVTVSDGDVKQIVFYDPGVGTQGGADHLFGGAFGIGLDRNISTAIGQVFHACAIDERRKVYGLTPMTKADNAATPKIAQAWFIGGHGSVGGGSKVKQPLSNIALL